MKGDYVEKQQGCFISVTLKKLVRPETFVPYCVKIGSIHNQMERKYICLKFSLFGIK